MRMIIITMNVQLEGLTINNSSWQITITTKTMNSCETNRIRFPNAFREHFYTKKSILYFRKSNRYLF